MIARRKREGFTIIELVAVLLILGIVTLAISEAYNGMIFTSEEQRSKMFANQDITFFARKMTNEMLGISRLLPTGNGQIFTGDFFLDKIISVLPTGDKVVEGRLAAFRLVEVKSPYSSSQAERFLELQVRRSRYRWTDQLAINKDNDGPDGVSADEYRKDAEGAFLDVDNADEDEDPKTGVDVFDDDGFPDDLGKIEVVDGEISKAEHRELVEQGDWETFFNGISPREKEAYILPVSMSFTFFDSLGIPLNERNEDLSSLGIYELNQARTMRVSIVYRRRVGGRILDSEEEASFVVGLGTLNS